MVSEILENTQLFLSDPRNSSGGRQIIIWRPPEELSGGRQIIFLFWWPPDNLSLLAAAR